MGENKIDADALLKEVIGTIKDVILANPNIVGDLFEKTGILPDEIYKIIDDKNNYLSINNIIHVYNTIQEMIEAKSQEILANIESEEAERLLNTLRNEVKEFVKANPNVVGELAAETGLKAEEVLKIIFVYAKPTKDVTLLHSAVQKRINAKVQEIKGNNLLSKESEDSLNMMLDEIRDYVQGNPNVVGELADRSGLPRDVIFNIAYSTNEIVPLSKIEKLHGIAEELKKENAQEMWGKGMAA